MAKQENNGKKHSGKRSGARKAVDPVRKEIQRGELEAIVDRAKEGALSDDERGTLKEAIETLDFLTDAIQAKDASIGRLRKLIFGASTEKASNLLGDSDSVDAGADAERTDGEACDARNSGSDAVGSG